MSRKREKTVVVSFRIPKSQETKLKTAVNDRPVVGVTSVDQYARRLYQKSFSADFPETAQVA